MTSTKKHKLMIVAGEVSGDMHGAALIDAIKKSMPTAYLYGMGMGEMQRRDFDCIVDAKAVSVMGFLEVLTHIAPIYKVWKTLKRTLLQSKPDVLILIDYPGMNLKLAKVAHQANIKVLYYIPPKVWALKKKRLQQIKQYVDQVAVIFPFEVDFYQSHAIKAHYVGNPTASAMPKLPSIANCQKAIGIEGKPLITILPGSRNSEIRHHQALLIDTIKMLHRQNPDLSFALAMAPQISCDGFRAELKDYPVHILKDQTYQAIKAADIVLCASGTATLETALIGTPMLIFYRFSAITYAIAKHFVKIPYAGLCNILAQKLIAPEFIQDQANPMRLCEEALELLNNKKQQQTMKQDFGVIKKQLGKHDAGNACAKILQTMLE